MNRGLFNSLVAAFIWVCVAVVVALPVEVVGGRWKEASTKLLVELHLLFLCVLIFIDVLIGAKLLQERRVDRNFRQNAMKIVLVLAIPAIIAGVIWRAAPTFFWENITIFGLCSFLVLWSLRYWTYHCDFRATPIKGPSIAP